MGPRSLAGGSENPKICNYESGVKCMGENRIIRSGLSVDTNLDSLITNICQGIEVVPERFWQGLATILEELVPENKRLLKKRQEIQLAINNWHLNSGTQGVDPEGYRRFLSDIGYLQPTPSAFSIATTGVDTEIAQVAGPQLVVPVMNARYALNAANARWGSFYDAVYGTDVLPEQEGFERGDTYNPRRGELVVSYVADFLDDIFPLDGCSHREVAAYLVTLSQGERELRVISQNGENTGLTNSSQFVGYINEDDPTLLLLSNNGLHVELHIDRKHTVGKMHPAGLKDVVLESAITTIQDCEDSVAAVDAEDKCVVYENWAGLMRGDLSQTLEKNGRTIKRELNEDRTYQDRYGNLLVLPGRSLMLVRNVGHLMTTDAVLDANGDEIPEGILDAMVTSLAGMHDLLSTSSLTNSRTGSIYIVKPKMHGPEEVAFTCDLFSKVELVLGLEPYSLKLGIMDEERRTTLNLSACIKEAINRVVFVNTGFLDRTGDEIHTSMLAGPFLRKDAIKGQSWIYAYEDANVDVALAAGFSGTAQVGKGMWAKPDEMREMVEVKISHPQAGANTAWVPSPTAATLHATHYHQVDVRGRQKELLNRTSTNVNDILEIPILVDEDLSSAEIQEELDNNVQCILGYVVHWIDRGVGCSKVLDIKDVGLMEDRATLRISSQHIANWLEHGICSRGQVEETLDRMAKIVDAQNKDTVGYLPMSSNLDNSIAFQAACDLIFKGAEQPNGYTEPLLHARRKEAKERNRI